MGILGGVKISNIFMVMPDTFYGKQQMLCASLSSKHNLRYNLSFCLSVCLSFMHVSIYPSVGPSIHRLFTMP